MRIIYLSCGGKKNGNIRDWTRVLKAHPTRDKALAYLEKVKEVGVSQTVDFWVEEVRYIEE